MNQSLVVSVAEACVAFDGRQVLHEVTLAVPQGQVVAVLGPNGSGKSTLIRAVLGLNHLSGGCVELFGTPVGQFRQWSRVGFVPQRTDATSGVPATVQEVVTSGRLSHLRRLRRQSAADREAVLEAIETVGLTTRRKDSVATLSGGQQQRVLIARALASDPDLLVLDEPTAGVDAQHQHALADALQRLVDRRVTILMVAHELGAMRPLIDRAVVMEHGRVACDGPPPTELHLHEHDPGHAHPLHEPETGSPWGLRHA